MAVVLSNLLKLSNIREWLRNNLFQLFANVKDKDMLRSVFAALGDNDLWVWMREFYRCIVWPLESSRRWGLICACAACQELRRQRKKPQCIWASRRLREAADHIARVVQQLLDHARDLSLADTGDIHWIHRDISLSARKTSACMKTKFHFLDCAPWAGAVADTPEGARKYVEILERIDDAALVPLAQKHKLLIKDMKAVSAGGDVSNALQDAVRRLNNCPLDGGPGEGFHRQTNLQKARAAASSRHYILSSARFKPNVKICKQFVCQRGGGQTSIQVRMAPC